MDFIEAVDSAETQPIDAHQYSVIEAPMKEVEEANNALDKQKQQDSSWWSFIKKQSDSVAETYRLEMKELVIAAKQDVTSLQTHLQTLTLPPALANMTLSLPPLDYTLLSQKLSQNSASTIGEFKKLTKKADALLESVESGLEQVEYMVGSLGKDLLGIERIKLPAGLILIQKNEFTYTQNPVSEQFNSFLEKFDESAHFDRICGLKRIKGVVEFAKEGRVCWARYFYKEAEFMKRQEIRKKVLEGVAKVDENGGEIVGWGDEDDSPVKTYDMNQVQMMDIEGSNGSSDSSIILQSDDIKDIVNDLVHGALKDQSTNSSFSSLNTTTKLHDDKPGIDSPDKEGWDDWI